MCPAEMARHRTTKKVSVLNVEDFATELLVVLSKRFEEKILHFMG